MFYRPFLIAVCLSMSLPAAAKDFVVNQREKTFSLTTIKAKVGDTLTFRNDDPFVHSIFSLSEVQTFDLGTFKQGDWRRVKLVKPGKIAVECAIHPQMKLVVEIAP